MTRATLGHTGQPLRAGAGTQAIYLLAFCAALLRIVAGLAVSMPLVWIAAAAWVAAFGGFAVLYGPPALPEPADLGRTQLKPLNCRSGS